MKNQIEKLITDMKLSEARERLLAIDIDSVPHSERRDFAQLCRKAGMFRRGLQFLFEVINQSKAATPADLIEYATILRRVGLLHEALRVLDRAPSSANTSLQKAFCHIQRWEHAAASGHLLIALESHPTEAESRLARLNLVASLTALNELDSALKWLNPLEAECRQHSFTHYLDCREVRAQIHLRRGELRAAKAILQDSVLAGAAGAPAKLLIRKWNLLIDVAENPSPETFEAIAEFKQQIRTAGHWESLRRMDWAVARVTGDKALAAKVYFGSPFAAFRQHILGSELGASIPDHCLRTDGRWKGQKPRLINGVTGQNMPFRAGTVHYRATMLLLSDNYQPWTIYRIFDGLFADENFDPFLAHGRVEEICEKIRAEVRKKQIPLELRLSRQGFRLRPRDEGAVILFDEPEKPAGPSKSNLFKIKAS